MLPPDDHIWISDDFPGHQMHSAGLLHQTAVPVAAQQYTTLNSETCPRTVWRRDMHFLYRYCPISTIFTFRNIRCSLELIAHTANFMYVKGGPAEIQIPAHCKLIGRSMNFPPPVLSPNSILPPLFSHCAFNRERKISVRF